LTVSAEEIIRDRKILKRESFLNLSWSSYLFSKLGILFLLSAVQTLTFIIIGNWILEIQGMTWAFWLMLFTVSCFANVLGLNISSAFNSAVTVYVLIPLLLIP
ncbi:MAG TPA: ABC transporter permease, partial [Cyclobacteriaceae bacterium]|nr:ABC transporter permease [Cyclobacteriaceae bacterium]